MKSGYSDIDEIESGQSSAKYTFGSIFGKILAITGFIIVISIALYQSGDFRSTGLQGSSISSLGVDTETCNCSYLITSRDCGDVKYPIMGGLDVVDYFSFTNETQVGTTGKQKYSYKYRGYHYYFRNKANMKLFKSDPDHYAPKFGGFCAWGVAGEYCPDYPWAADCLGPSGDWSVWTVYNSSLYFFFVEEAKGYFMADPSKYAVEGQARWDNWFSDQEAVYNTLCFFEDQIYHGVPISNTENMLDTISEAYENNKIKTSQVSEDDDTDENDDDDGDDDVDDDDDE